ncbi:hypothetical protein FRC12_001619 [Ceratobasidium sp. 428]|nr:hypothetical protein FRC12_001619 [Ceratobasidium sp. 428]
MLPILDAATSGRVTPYRLWRLVISRGFFQDNPHYATGGVDYGPIEKLWDDRPRLFGDLHNKALIHMEDNGTPEEIAELLRSAGYWMWMRPDRFPICTTNSSHTRRPLALTSPIDPDPLTPISCLPIELLLHLCSELSISGIVALAETGKAFYNQLIGTHEARDTLAKVYMRLHARWCLPHGEAELEWWNDRNGDDALGWDYMRRCHTGSYSMRNRRRIWQVAESIENECEKEEANAIWEM